MSESTNSSFEMPKAGAQHKLLKPFEGKFKAIVKIFMGGHEPQVSTGTMTNSLQLDDLYLHQEYQGHPVSPNWPAFAGRGYWGYNFGSQRYEGFWIDNASSIMQFETGTVDEAGKVLTMTSEIVHPRNGMKMKKRSLIELIDNDRHSMESFMAGPDGREFPTMTIDYLRF